jgi:hypothetical protein
MLSKELLEELYNGHRLSMAEIAKRLDCSQNKVAYWMEKYGIPRRDISEAIYQWHNPDGDPFEIREPVTENERRLFDLGVGLYIGEGTKKNPYGVLLANSDPQVIRAFVRFLYEICGVKAETVSAQINIFDDVDLESAQAYWEEVTGLPRSQFYKPTVRSSRGGTYENKSEYGTVTVSVHNTKLREIILDWCQEYLDKYG